MLPGGRSLSRMPQRCIWRQSYLGAAKVIGVVVISPAFSPFKMRTAIPAVAPPTSSANCIGPPTIPSPRNASLCAKIGALDAAASRLNALLSSCATPAASTLIRCQ